MAATTTTVDYLSKLLYGKGYKDKDLYKNKPLLQAMKKEGDFDSAQGMIVALDYTLGSAVGRTMASAVTNASDSAGVSILVPQAHLYGYVALNGEVFRNAKARSGTEGKLIDYAKKQFSDGLETVMEELARVAHSTSTGTRGTIESVTTTTIVLTNPQDALFFRVGMIIGASATDGGALRSGTPGYATITKVTASTGTLTFASDLTVKIGSIQAGDKVVQYGNASNNGAAVGFYGVEDWNPLTVGTLGGEDLTVSPSQLAGIRYTQGGPMETIFIRARAQAFGEIGSRFTMGEIYLHPEQFAEMAAAKEGAKTVDDASSYELGINKMKIGTHTFVEDPFCPVDVGRIIPKGGLELHTAGKQPEMGSPFDDPDVDQVKVKLHVDGNILTHSPCNFVRVTLVAPR
jgi:hypothetical protein